MTRRRWVVMAVVVAAVAIAAAVATSPHPWAGKLWCDLQGGEWTNRFGSRYETIVSAGRTCVK